MKNFFEMWKLVEQAPMAPQAPQAPQQAPQAPQQAPQAPQQAPQAPKAQAQAPQPATNNLQAQTQKQNLNPQKVNEINQKLINAFKGGPAQVRAYLNSAEGKSEEVRNILKQGVDPKSDTVAVSGPSPVGVKGLIPTQNFIDLMQSVSFPLGSVKSLLGYVNSGTGFGTIVKDGNLIIDGHHRWSGIYAINPNGSINALNATWPGQNTKEKLAAAQLAIANTLKPGQEMPSASGTPETDILGKGSDEIYQMIIANVGRQTDPKAPGPLLNDQMINDIIQSKEKAIYQWAEIPENEQDSNKIREYIAKKVANNLAELKKNEDAPAREDMPQFDPKKGGPDFTDITPSLQKGQLNVNMPFVGNKQISASVSYEGPSLNEWLVLAGVKKNKD